jgi:mono/diheme cytochrome c family protein
VGKLRVTSVVVCGLGMLFALESMGEKHTFHNAPASVIQRKNPFTGSSKAVEAGRKLYYYECSQCHGEKGGGGVAAAAPLRSGPTQSATPGELFWFISTGEPEKGMPPWSSLSEKERWQILTYLKSLGGGRNRRQANPESLPGTARSMVSHKKSTPPGFHAL